MSVLEKTPPVQSQQKAPLVPRAALVRWVIILALVAVLELTTRTGMISQSLMVPPSEILARLASIVPTEQFGQDAARTLTTILVAFTIGLVLGVPLGVFLWRVPAAGRILEPFIVTGYAMPTLLFYPVLLAVMGLNAGPIIVIAASMSLIPIALTTMVALNAIKPILHKLANSVSASPRQYYLKVLFPAATPLIFPGVKLGFIYAVIGTVAMEFILASQGVGFRAGFYYRELNTADMWAYIAVVIVLSVLVNSVLLLNRAQAQELGIELELGHAATGIDVAGNLLQLQGREALRFDNLVIATGASARPSPWGHRSGIHVLRTLNDARSLRANIIKGGQLAVIGAGFIGAEAAATARGLGLEVTVIDPLPVPMSRIFNAEVGQWFGDLHRSNGVKTIFGTGVEAIDGEQGSFTLRLTNGQNLEADTVLVGIGAVPNDAWLGSSGLLVDNGLVLDEYCRTVDAPHIYGVGDVARWRHQKHGEDIRIEHWTNAVEQAACVAYNITHPENPRAYTPVEYVWSDQHDWKIQVVGRVGGKAEHVTIGHPEVHGRFAALYTVDGVNLSGAAIVNWPKALLACRRGMGPGITVQELREKLEPMLDPQPLTAS